MPQGVGNILQAAVVAGFERLDLCNQLFDLHIARINRRLLFAAKVADGEQPSQPHAKRQQEHDGARAERERDAERGPIHRG